MAKHGEPWTYVPGRGIRTADGRFVGDAWPAYRKIIIEAVNDNAALRTALAESEARVRELEGEVEGFRKGAAKIQRRFNDYKKLRRIDAESNQKCRRARKQDRKFIEQLKGCPSWAALFDEWRERNAALFPTEPRKD